MRFCFLENTTIGKLWWLRKYFPHTCIWEFPCFLSIICRALCLCCCIRMCGCQRAWRHSQSFRKNCASTSLCQSKFKLLCRPSHLHEKVLIVLQLLLAPSSIHLFFLFFVTKDVSLFGLWKKKIKILNLNYLSVCLYIHLSLKSCELKRLIF